MTQSLSKCWIFYEIFKGRVKNSRIQTLLCTWFLFRSKSVSSNNVLTSEEPWMNVHGDDVKIRINVQKKKHKAMLARPIESFNHKSKISSVLNGFMIFWWNVSLSLVFHAYGLFMYDITLNWYWRWKHLLGFRSNFRLAICLFIALQELFLVSNFPAYVCL